MRGKNFSNVKNNSPYKEQNVLCAYTFIVYIHSKVFNTFTYTIPSVSTGIVLQSLRENKKIKYPHSHYAYIIIQMICLLSMKKKML